MTPAKPDAMSPEAMFEGFSQGQVLIGYDFPLLRVIESPNGEKWLVSWCGSNESESADGVEPEGARHRWIAFPTTQETLAGLETDRMALRDVLELHQGPVFLVEGQHLFRPSAAKSIHTFDIPQDCLPKRGLSIHGKTVHSIQLPSLDLSRLVLDFHLFPKAGPSGRVSFFLSGPIEETFQRVLASTGHRLSRVHEKRIDLAYGPGDVYDIAQVATVTGSYRIIAQPASSDSRGDQKIVRALACLKELSDPTSTSSALTTVAEKMGPDATLQVLSLLRFLEKQELAITVTWTLGDEEDSIVLDGVRAGRLIRRLKTARDRLESAAVLTIQLSPDEANRLRLPVNGQGGMQSLLRGLRRGLSENGVLSVTPDQIERIVRYAQSYGEGGFQSRFQGILREVKRLGLALAEVR